MHAHSYIHTHIAYIRAQVTVTIPNRAANNKVNLKVVIPWHYPSGRLNYSVEVRSTHRLFLKEARDLV